MTKGISKTREDYTHLTRSVAALGRAADLDLTRAPGQRISYVVVDDEKRSRDRVALVVEEPTEYDIEFYRELLVRTAESVVSPLGWRESDIDRNLATYSDFSLQSFTMK